VKLVHGWVSSDKPLAYLFAGFRNKDEPYARLWLRTYDGRFLPALEASMSPIQALVEGPDYLDFDLGMLQSEEALAVFVNWMDAMLNQLNRMYDLQTMQSTEQTGEQDG
jgi:hypothetical protein